MKRTLLLLFTALMNWTMATAQAQPSVDEGYVFVTNLKSYSKKSLKSRTRSVIPAGHVAIATENNMFRFPCVDAAEYIILRSGAFHEYYPPAQEEVPPEFISRAAFNKAVRKVNISSQVPSSWELGKVYSFKPVSTDGYFKTITVKPLRLSSSDVTLVTMVDDIFQPTSSINISGKTIVKIEFEDNTVYLYDGRQIVLDTNCLISSLSRRGQYYPVWKGLQAGEYVLCVSTEILENFNVFCNGMNYRHFILLLSKTV